MAGEQILTNRPLFGAQLNMAHPLTKGLVGYWLLNETGGMRAMDLSPYGNHGLVTGAQGRWQGRSFDGTDDDIYTPHHAAFLTSTAVTASAWVKPNTGYGEVVPRIIAKEGMWDVNITAASGVVNFLIIIAGVARTFTTVDALMVGVWTLVTAQFDGTTARIYFNTASKKEDATWAGEITGSEVYGIRLGDRADSLRCLNGLISEASVYNRALTPLEIQQLYTNPYDMFMK